MGKKYTIYTILISLLGKTPSIGLLYPSKSIIDHMSPNTTQANIPVTGDNYKPYVKKVKWL